jgi:16S rRNA (cytidine1402-2'-O)-methyltransferase
VTGAGMLVLCPTPVGNLEDITLRALRALRECDVIFAEDTRVTQKLLSHFDIHKPLKSFPPGAQASRLRTLRSLLEQGKTVAMVSDAGTPAVSDPGSELVREARSCGAAVEALPGPSAVLGALGLSGFDVSAFCFDGFPPRKSVQRRAYLDGLEGEPRAIVWFEAPSRVVDLLQDVAAILPARRVFVLREYTKRFEQHLWGVATDVLAQISTPARGEFTLVLEGSHASKASVASGADRGRIESALAFLHELGISAKDATEAVRLTTGLPRNELYRMTVSARKRSD